MKSLSAEPDVALNTSFEAQGEIDSGRREEERAVEQDRIELSACGFDYFVPAHFEGRDRERNDRANAVDLRSIVRAAGCQQKERFWGQLVNPKGHDPAVHRAQDGD